MTKGIVLLAAGGTGGHLFPAEALGHLLAESGLSISGIVRDTRIAAWLNDSATKSLALVDVARSLTGLAPLHQLDVPDNYGIEGADYVQVELGIHPHGVGVDKLLDDIGAAIATLNSHHRQTTRILGS